MFSHTGEKMNSTIPSNFSPTTSAMLTLSMSMAESMHFYAILCRNMIFFYCEIENEIQQKYLIHHKWCFISFCRMKNISLIYWCKRSWFKLNLTIFLIEDFPVAYGQLSLSTSSGRVRWLLALITGPGIGMATPATRTMSEASWRAADGIPMTSIALIWTDLTPG